MRRRGWIPGFISDEELISPGLEGVMKAYATYDMSKGAAFTSYAYNGVSMTIGSYLRIFGCGGTSRNGASADMLSKGRLVYAQHSIERGNIATGGDPIDIRNHRRFSYSESPETKELMEWAKKELSQEQWSVIDQLWLKDMTLDQVARRSNVSREWIRQIEIKSMEILRSRARETFE